LKRSLCEMQHLRNKESDFALREGFVRANVLPLHIVILFE